MSWITTGAVNFTLFYFSSLHPLLFTLYYKKILCAIFLIVPFNLFFTIYFLHRNKFMIFKLYTFFYSMSGKCIFYKILSSFLNINIINIIITLNPLFVNFNSLKYNLFYYNTLYRNYNTYLLFYGAKSWLCVLILVI